jgi:Ca2+-binding EF-hand superfamily protein
MATPESNSKRLRELYKSAADMSDLKSLSTRVNAMKQRSGNLPVGARGQISKSPSDFNRGEAGVGQANGGAGSSARGEAGRQNFREQYAVARRFAKEARTTLKRKAQVSSPFLEMGAAAAFAPFDVNRDGLVTKKEFHAALQCVAPSATEVETKQILEEVDPCGRGGDLVNYRAFTDLVHESDGASSSARPRAGHASPSPLVGGSTASSDTKGAEDRLLSRFTASSSRLRHAMKRADTDYDGRLDATQFSRSLKQLNVDVNPKQVDDLIARYDVDGNGTIAYDHFVDSIDRAKNTSRARSPTSLAKEVVDKIFKNSSVEMMAKHFRDLNTSKDGTLAPETVERGLRLQGATLSKTDMDSLLDSTRSNANGQRIDYRKLVNLMANADRPEDHFSTRRSTVRRRDGATAEQKQPPGGSNPASAMWWARSEGKEASENRCIVDDTVVRSLNGKITHRRANLHQQKSSVLVVDPAPAGQRERTQMERSEAIVQQKIIRAVDDNLGHVQQMFDSKAAEGLGTDRLTHSELREGLKDCGVQLGNEDFNRLVGVTDPTNQGDVSFGEIEQVMHRQGADREGAHQHPGHGGRGAKGAHYLQTTEKMHAAGRPSSWQTSLLYQDSQQELLATDSRHGIASPSPRAGGNPTFHSSMRTEPSREWIAENRRGAASPTGGTRPNASVGFGRATGNVLVADFMRGSLPAEAPAAHLFAPNGMPVAPKGRRQLHTAANLHGKESGNRAKVLLCDEKSVGLEWNGQGPEEYRPQRRSQVFLYGEDAAGMRTVDSRSLRRMVPDFSKSNGHYSDGVAESLGHLTFHHDTPGKPARGKKAHRRRGKRAAKTHQRNTSSFSHSRSLGKRDAKPKTPSRGPTTFGRGSRDSTFASPLVPSGGIRKPYRILTPTMAPPPPPPPSVPL